METRLANRLSHPDAALDWSGNSPSARLARVNKPLRCRPLEGRRDQKSPLRRCFKPRPPLRAGCAGFASGCQSSVRSCDHGGESQSSAELVLLSLRSRSGRLSGLLSGCPPTDTRPQARAKLGNSALSPMCTPMQAISTSRVKNSLALRLLAHTATARDQSTLRTRVLVRAPITPPGAVATPLTPCISKFTRSR
jgi:hypothetical protein